jgi:hypothetical protein
VALVGLVLAGESALAQRGLGGPERLRTRKLVLALVL